MTPKARDGVLRGGSALAIRLLIAVAAGISAYLLSVSLSGGRTVGCAPGSACDVVLQSRWAYVVGIPVSALALLADAVLLIATFSAGPKSTPAQRRKAWELMIPCSILIIGAALWFMAVQIVILKRYCPWCMAAHLCGTIAGVLLLIRVPVRDVIERPDKDPSLARSTTMKLAVVAIGLVAMMGMAQIAIAPKTYSETAVPAARETGSNVAAATAVADTTTQAPASAPQTSTVTQTQSANVTAPAPVLLSVYGGAVNLDLTQTPLWGSPSAPHKLVSLFDYTCHHCAVMHSRVAEVFRQFSNKLAVISLPMPLDGQCNPMIRRTPPAHSNACNYARLGLGVWRANPQVLEPYDDWYFERYHQVNAGPRMGGYQAPEWNEVYNQALQMAGGPARLEAAQRDPRVEQALQSAIAIYSISNSRFRNGSMPQFIIGTNLLSGTVETETLRALVSRYVSATQ